MQRTTCMRIVLFVYGPAKWINARKTQIIHKNVYSQQIMSITVLALQSHV